MTTRTVPFHYGLFFNAMVTLLGREPDTSYRHGWDGMYTFRYEPKDDIERKKFAREVGTLQEWLNLFELKPLQSRCEYGRLLQPSASEEGKDYLDIRIVHPVSKSEAR